MILELGALMASAYYPINFVFFSPTVGTTTATYSALGLGADVRYLFSHKFFVDADYEINFGARTKTTLLHGFGLGAGYYMLGGAGSSVRKSYLSAIAAPVYSLYLGGGITQRNYDITTSQSKKTDELVVSKNKHLPNEGSFWSLKLAAGYEHSVAVEAFRVGAELGFQTSVASSGPVSVSILSLQLSARYQL